MEEISAYKVMIDPDQFKEPDRRTRTKDLLAKQSTPKPLFNPSFFTTQMDPPETKPPPLSNFFQSYGGSDHGSHRSHGSRRSHRSHGSHRSHRSHGSHRSQSKELSEEQRRIIFSTIKEYLPGEMHDVIFQDVVSQMNQLESKYPLPRGYKKDEQTIDANEIRLYQQQVARDRDKDKSKMVNLLKFSSLGLSWFCNAMNFDWIKLNNLPKLITASIEEGEFSDCLEGVGNHLRGTVFDNPFFSTAIKFIEKVGEAHHMELEAKQDAIEEEQERKYQRDQQSLQKLNAYRNPGATIGLPVPRKVVPPLSDAPQAPAPAPAYQAPAPVQAPVQAPAPQTPDRVTSMSKTAPPGAPKKKPFTPLPYSILPKGVDQLAAGLTEPMKHLETMLNEPVSEPAPIRSASRLDI